MFMVYLKNPRFNNIIILGIFPFEDDAKQFHESVKEIYQDESLQFGYFAELEELTIDISSALKGE